MGRSAAAENPFLLPAAQFVAPVCFNEVSQSSDRQTMNRRQFNQTMAVLGAITTLPALACLNHVMAEPELGLEGSLIRIGLVSVGGADGNTVAAIAQGLPYVTSTIAIDTDAVALSSAGAGRTVLIGNGMDRPQHPRQAMEMARRRAAKIEAAIGDLDLLIVIAGMYGAAGKGMAPVVADIARRKDIGTLGIAITPAEWKGVESNPRVRYAVKEFQRAGASVFPINSQHMAQALGKDAPCVSQTVRNLCASVGHAVNQGQIVYVDRDGLRLALEPGGIAAMGFGSATGSDRVESAINGAIAHPLLGMDRLLSATGVLVNVRGNAGLHFSEVNEVARGIRSRLTLDPWLLYTGAVDESAGDQLIVSILATVPEAAAPAGD